MGTFEWFLIVAAALLLALCILMCNYALTTRRELECYKKSFGQLEELVSQISSAEKKIENLAQIQAKYNDTVSGIETKIIAKNTELEHVGEELAKAKTSLIGAQTEDSVLRHTHDSKMEALNLAYKEKEERLNAAFKARIEALDKEYSNRAENYAAEWDAKRQALEAEYAKLVQEVHEQQTTLRIALEQNRKDHEDEGRHCLTIPDIDRYEIAELADVCKSLGHKTKVVKCTQCRHDKAEHKSGELAKCAYNTLKVTVLVLGGNNSLLEFFVYVVNVVSGVKLNLNAGVGGLEKHVLLDGHKAFKLVSVENSLSCDKTVKRRALSHRSDVSGNNYMKKAHVCVALFFLFCEVIFNLGNVNSVLKLILRVCSYLHKIRHECTHWRNCPKASSVIAVAKALFAFLVGRGVVLENILVLFINCCTHICLRSIFSTLHYNINMDKMSRGVNYLLKNEQIWRKVKKMR